MSESKQAPTKSQRIAETITQASGTMAFLVINVALFAVWIAANTLSPWQFDKYPFQFLTMAVSLEAIVLAIFVLITQNRQVAFDRNLNERDAQVNRKTEREIQQMAGDVQWIKRMLAEKVVMD